MVDANTETYSLSHIVSKCTPCKSDIIQSDITPTKTRCAIIKME